MLDVSTRIVVSLFDYLFHKDFDLTHIYSRLGDQHDRSVLIPDSMRLNPGYVSWGLFSDLIDAVADVIGTDSWAEEFLEFSIEANAPWILPVKSAATTLTTPFDFYNFIVNWYPRIEIPFISTDMRQDNELFLVTVTIPAESGRERTFLLLKHFFKRVPNVIGLPSSDVSFSGNDESRTYKIRFVDPGAMRGSLAGRIKQFFNGESGQSSIQDFYLQLAKSYESLLKDRAGFYQKNIHLESRLKTQISEVHSAQNTVREHEAYLEAIFANIDAIVLLTDKNGDVLSANRNYYDLLRTDEKIVPPGSRTILNELSELVAEVYQAGSKCEREISMPANGGIHWYTIKCSPVIDASGKIIACVCVGINITRQKTLEKITAESMEDLATNSRVRSTFVSNVSHELRTPLTSIMGFVELLQGSQVSPEKTKTYLEVIRNNGMTLLGLINNLLDIAKIESGHKVLKMSPVDTIRCFEEIRQATLKIVTNSPLEFSFQIDDNITPEIQSDQARIRQVVGNLIDNALKFTTQGFVHVHVTNSSTSLDGKNRFVDVHVRDSGQGIKKHHAHLLFSPAHTGDRKLNADLPGAGISLYLSKKIAQELKGDVSYVDDSEKGAHFVFHLNTGQPTEKSRHLESYRDYSDVRTASQGLAGKRILLMDDVADIQMLYSTILKMSGAAVDVANSGVTGLELARLNDYDIIIVDLKMPEIDGFEATRRLRSSGYTRPIIALTSYARPQERSLSLEAGCNDHISKPVGASQLVDKICRWLE